MFDEINIIVALVVCIIIYIIVNYYYNSTIDINVDNINNKFVKNKKLNNIEFQNIKILKKSANTENLSMSHGQIDSMYRIDNIVQIEEPDTELDDIEKYVSVNNITKTANRIVTISLTGVNTINTIKLNKSVNKIIIFLNKYLEKKYKYDYNLDLLKIKDIIIEYNDKYKLYKMNYILHLDILKLNVELYLDIHDEIYISSLIKLDDLSESDLILDIDNDIDLIDIFSDTQKLYEISDKLRDMKYKGYNIKIEELDSESSSPDKLIQTNNRKKQTTAKKSEMRDGLKKNMVNSGTVGGNRIEVNTNPNNNSFLNGDNICDGCFDNVAIISCDVTKDNFSKYALF
jgi:hypothetical protein